MEKMKNLGYYNGQIGLIEEMTVPMTDRAHWFGDGIYEATCTRNGRIYGLNDHVDRLYRSAEIVRITPPLPKEELKTLLTDLLARVDTSATANEANIYFQFTRGAGTLRNHAFPPKSVKPSLWVTVTPKRTTDTYRPVKLVTTEDIRYHMCNVKTICLMPNVLAAESAAEAGADECVQYRVYPDGSTRVTEGAHTNVYAIFNGVLYTHPLCELVLAGISRKNILRACERLGIPYAEKPFSLDEMRKADEIMVSSSSNFCLRAESLDGKPCGGKATDLVRALQDTLVADYLAATDV